MSILITFVPWLIYWIFLSFRSLHLAIYGGLVAAIAVNYRELRQLRPKVLKLGTLIFFIVLSIALPLIDLRLIGRWVGLLGPVTLALITLVSILIRQPFTLQYAREEVPKERWDSPQFIRSNYVITWAWFAAFVLMTAPSVAELSGIHVGILAHWLISLCCFFAAFAFTHWYRGRVRSASHRL